MKKPTALISIDTYVETETASFGRSFIQSLCDEDQRLIPEKLSTDEDYKDSFLGIDDLLENWWSVPVHTTVDGQARPDSFDDVAWIRRSALASRGIVNHGVTDLKGNKHPAGIWYECRWHKGINFSDLFEAWVALSRSDIAMLHVFTEPELTWGNEKFDRSFRLGVLSGASHLGIPNIGWAMAYGAGYAAEVDVARIKAAGFPVDEANGVIIVRVTDKLADVVDDFEHFSRRRATLKALFRPELFWIKEEPSERAR